MASRQRNIWLVGACVTIAVMAITFGVVAYVATLAVPYKNTTIGYVVINCDAKHLYDPESCGDILEGLLGRIAEHVMLAVAASIAMSTVGIGSAWWFGRNNPSAATKNPPDLPSGHGCAGLPIT